MNTAFMFLYESTTQYFVDAHAQLEGRGKIQEIIWYRPQTST